MWRKLKFVHMWIDFKFLHMTNVEKSEISLVVCTIYSLLLHFTLFCWKICLFFVELRCFVAKSFLQFTRFYVEKNLAKKSARGEKITNIRYASALSFLSTLDLRTLLSVAKLTLSKYKLLVHLLYL